MSTSGHTLSGFFEANVYNICHRVSDKLAMKALPWQFAVDVLGLTYEPDIKHCLSGPSNVGIAIIGTRDHVICLSQCLVFFNQNNIFKCEAGVYIYSNKNEAYENILKEHVKSEALGINLYAKEITLKHLLNDAILEDPDKIEHSIIKHTHAHGFSQGRKQHTAMRNLLLQFDRVVVNMVMMNMKKDDDLMFARLIIHLCDEWAKNTTDLMRQGWNVWLQELWELYGTLYKSGHGIFTTTKEINQSIYDHFLGNYCCACCGTQPKTRKDHKKCGKCQQIYYCSKECQKNHWNQHKTICNSSPRCIE
jgi:hypothetical protein